MGDKDVSALAKAGKITITGSQPIALVHEPLPATHPFYAMVGRVASEFSHLEHVLDLIIWDLIAVPGPVGACVTSQMMGPASRFRAIMALGPLKRVDKRILARVDALMRRTFNAADKRHRIVHDPWYMDTGTEEIGQFRSMPAKDPKYGIQDIDEDDVMATIAEIRERIGEASTLRAEILASLAPSSGKRRQ